MSVVEEIFIYEVVLVFVDVFVDCCVVIICEICFNFCGGFVKVVFGGVFVVVVDRIFVFVCKYCVEFVLDVDVVIKVVGMKKIVKFVVVVVLGVYLK